jgi:short-subunit dehydrogenase
VSEFREKYGPWGLVAGASVGLGAAFATELARRKLNLILLARRVEPLEALAERLRGAFAVEVRTVAADLGDAKSAEICAGLAREHEIGLLVYNAAHSKIGPFLDGNLEDHLRTVDVNCRGPVALSLALGRPMAERKRGGIVLMSSLAGSQGTPMVATYGATKAFNLVLAEGLWDELKQNGVDVLACRAGATRTPGYEASQPSGSVPMMDPEPVVAAALARLGRGPSMVPGGFNRFVAFVMGRLLPRRVAVSVMGNATRKLYARS